MERGKSSAAKNVMFFGIGWIFLQIGQKDASPFSAPHVQQSVARDCCITY